MKSSMPVKRQCLMQGGLVLLALLAPLAHAQADPPQLDAGVASGSVLKRRPAPSAPNIMAAPEDLSKARLSPGYLLQMEIYDTPEMDATLRVDGAGNVSIPLVGPVHIEGNTLLEAQTAIEQALVRGEILKAPQVSLNVLQFATGSATVLGEVQQPGRVQLLAPRSLAEVLAQAGGVTFSAGSKIDIQHTAANNEVTVQHVHYVASVTSNTLQSAVVYPGDTVIVNRAGAIYVLGGVFRPGAYLMVNGGRLNLLEAISLAQGTLTRASVSEVDILRATGESYTRIRVPLSAMQKGKVQPAKLEVNDIVYVPVSKAKSILLDGGSLLGAAATASIYAIR